MTLRDILIVAPFNMQVRALKRRLGNIVAASRRLHAVDMRADVAVDQLAPWLIECLSLPAAEGASKDAAEAHARSLLAAGRVPPVFVPRLERALAAQTRAG